MSKIILTIIIPYHAQEQTLSFLERQLNYYNNHSVVVKVILALSGTERLREKTKKILYHIENPNFSVIESTENNIKNFVSYMSKTYLALRNTITEYVAINGVDDLIIPDVALKVIQAMESDKDISGAKGQTVYYTKDSGRLFASYDIDFMEKSTQKREKKAAQDLDSVWYIIRRKKNLQEEYKLLIELIETSPFSNCLYSIEVFKSLLTIAKGKIFVLNEPWRIQTSHTHNHSSYVPASIIRLEVSYVSKYIFKKLKSQVKYNQFIFLTFISNIRSASNVTFKQILYRFLKEHKNIFMFVRSLIYLVLSQIFYIPFIKIKGMFKKKKNRFYDIEIDFNSKPFKTMKAYYFTGDEVEKIEKNHLNNVIKTVY